MKYIEYFVLLVERTKYVFDSILIYFQFKNIYHVYLTQS